MGNILPEFKHICKTSFLCIGFLYGTNACAQKGLVPNMYDTTQQSVNELYTLWNNYKLCTTNSDSGAYYWLDADKRRFPVYDVSGSYGCLPMSNKYKTYLTYISRQEEGVYEMKALVRMSDDGYLADTRVMAVKTTSGYKLQNYLSYTTRNWAKHTTGTITFYSPADYPYNEADAQRSEAFLQRIAKEFGITPLPISFYVVKDCEQAYHIAGIDFYSYNVSNPLCGCMDTKNNIIYSGGRGFYYPHELVHVVNTFFPKAHPSFLIGISGLYGGHFGKPLSYHQPRVLAYIKAHPERDFNNLDDMPNVDQFTNAQYVVYGLLCEAVIRKGGTTALKRLFNYGTTEADLYTALEKELGLKRKDIQAFIVQRLEDKDYFRAYNEY